MALYQISWYIFKDSSLCNSYPRVGGWNSCGSLVRFKFQFLGLSWNSVWLFR